jgi:hypothetical protein
MVLRPERRIALRILALCRDIGTNRFLDNWKCAHWSESPFSFARHYCSKHGKVIENRAQRLLIKVTEKKSCTTLLIAAHAEFRAV